MAPKADEDVEMKGEEGTEEVKKEPEPAKELETDAAAAKPFLKAGQCGFNTEDTTMNVMPTVNGKLLMALSDGGFQYLLAGARGNVGVKAGRYMFEVMIAEAKSMTEPQGRIQGPKPKQLVRVGLATADAHLILGTVDSSESVCFDSTGFFAHGRKREQVSKKFGHSQAAALLVNLEPGSPNANTVSLFVNGVRASEPLPIPESMKGKVLYPAVTYRNVTLQVNFGTAPLRSLPFKCHTWSQVQKVHSEVKAAFSPKDGKYEILLPVGLPDEGTFDWVDQFLSKNRTYTELSDRAILDWANKSGLQRNGGYLRRNCNDKPEMNFGLALMDDFSVSRVMKVVARALPRNFVIAEVKKNLTEEDRRKTLSYFPSACYKKVVQVMMGEPPADYKKYIQQEMLKEKQLKAEQEARRKKAEAARKKQEEERQKKMLEQRKKREEAKKKAIEAKAAMEAMTENGEAEGEEAKAEEKEEEKEEAKEEAKEEEEVKEEEKEPEEEIKVELTEEEKKLWFRKKEIPDLTSQQMSVAYPKFSMPSKAEACDELKFAWAKEPQCQEYLKKWVQERKMTQRVEELQPSEWFRAKWNEWNKYLGLCKRKQQEFKDPVRRKAALAQKKREEAKKKAAEETTEEKTEATEGEEKPEEKTEETAEKAEEKAPEEEKAEEEPEAMDVDADSLDPFLVEDVKDIGNGQPLFADFTFEDWMLLSLRFELHLLCHAFKHDLDDPERPSFKEDHLAFYYNKYYKRQFNLKTFGCEELAPLLALVKDSVEMKNTTFEPQLSEDSPLDNFIRLTEDGRRDRKLRIDSGDELAVLKFQRQGVGVAPPGKGEYPSRPGPVPGKGAPPAQGKGAYSRGPVAPPPGKGGYKGGGFSSAPPPKRPHEGGGAYQPAKTARTSYGGGYGGPPSGGTQRVYGGERQSYGGGGGYGSAYSRK
mmetsp:Transcript_101773/g.180744  ORF Transcript_101773/g.180744 Transcript_101773/m.180744 type:complete len:930 (-) Transcript_101773:79-2868(-)